jgi:pantothenate kinase type III
VGEAQVATIPAIEGGIVSAQLGALHLFIRWFSQALGEEAAKGLRIVVTGGAAGAILRESDYQLIHDSLVVFKGMLLSRHGSSDQ